MAPTAGILSPWAAPANLGGVIVSEALGLALDNLPMSRGFAMSVPAVARGRHLIVSSIASLPFTMTRAGQPVDAQPRWLTRTDTAVAPAERIARTVDSLIFNGRALWAVERANGRITDAAWVPDDEWTITADSKIQIRGSNAEESQVILFSGYNDGLLTTAARTLRNALAIENARVSRARNPIPLTVISHAPTASGANVAPELYDGRDGTPDEVGELLEKWGKLRRSEDGATGYLPPGLVITTYGETGDSGFTELANALRVDIASHLGIPATLLDGSVAEASLTYTTTEGNANRFWTETLPLYIAPIENALSLAVRGTATEIRAGVPEFLSNPTNPVGAPDSPATTEVAA